MDASRSAPDAAPRRIGFGLATRVAAVLLVALAVSIDVPLLVASGLRQVDRNLEQITEHQVPTLLQVGALLGEAQRLVSLAPELVTARDVLTYDALGGQVDAIEQRTREILTRLAEAPALPASELSDLRGRSTALTERLRELLAVIDRRILLEQRRRVLRERLHLVANRLQQASAEASATNGDGCLLRWQTALGQLVAELLALDANQVPSQLDDAVARFELIGRRFRAEGVCVQALLPKAMPFDANAMQAEIIALGQDGGLFTLERERVALREQLDNGLRGARWHGEALLGQAERLFAETRSRIGEQGRETRALLSKRLLLLTLTPLVLLATTIGVYWYLSRALLRPIQGLREALRTAFRGGTPRFPPAGRDEVGAIIDASRETLQALAARERELHAAIAHAERASHAKSTFLTHMSHELRTPLNAILGFAELLHGRLAARTSNGADGDGKPREWCATILRGGHHLRRLIEDSLDLGAIEAGRMQIAPTDVDLPALIGEIAGSLSPRAREKGLTFELILSDDLPRQLRLDPHRLRQVLLNLVGNAVKYTETGTVRLQAETLPDASGAARLHLCVEDTGPGIPAHARDRLFLPFEQLHPGQPGSGLGLAITRELVELMDGRIKLDSHEGRGSTFSVELPAVATRRTARPASSMPGVTGYGGQRRRLLVVDDIASNRALLAEQLEAIGFRVDQAADPETAATQAVSNPPDLVLMDMAMPNWCGYAGAYAVRTACARADLPVVIVSATPLQPADARALGFETALIKPVQTPELLDVIKASLGLQWITDREPSGELVAADDDMATDDSATQKKTQMTTPPKNHDADLRTTRTPDTTMLLAPIRIEIDAALDLAADGQKDTLADWCGALVDGQPELAPFADQARAFLAADDLSGLRAWLAQWR